MILVPVVLLLYPSVWFHKVTVSAMCIYNGFYLFLSRLRTIFLALENSPLSLSFYPCQLCRGLILCKWPRAQVISQQNAKPEFTARVMPGQWSGALVSNAGEKMVSHLLVTIRTLKARHGWVPFFLVLKRTSKQKLFISTFS